MMPTQFSESGNFHGKILAQADRDEKRAARLADKNVSLPVGIQHNWNGVYMQACLITQNNSITRSDIAR
jgi:hypothetical protein